MTIPFFKTKDNRVKEVIRYAGQKGSYIPTIKKLSDKYKTLDTYTEPFLGSAIVATNIACDDKFAKVVLNDSCPHLNLIYNALSKTSFQEYKIFLKKVEEKFGDIKNSKESYYSFRNECNKDLESDFGSLGLLLLANSCINSMLRFGPNGMNQSYGNRHFVLDKESLESFCSVFAKTNNGITCSSYEEILTPEINNALIFLDPPYEDAPMAYNRGFQKNNFLEVVKKLDDNNLIIYTDVDNTESDVLLDFGFSKFDIRDMKTIAPLAKKGEAINKEVSYIREPK